jgi:hypothetical protein
MLCRMRTNFPTGLARAIVILRLAIASKGVLGSTLCPTVRRIATQP